MSSENKMKSARHGILASLKDGEKTLDDLQAALALPRKQMHDNLNACKKDGLIATRRDDATGLPAYKLTSEGKTRLDGIESGDVVRGRKSRSAIDTSVKPVVEKCKASSTFLSENEAKEQHGLLCVIGDIRRAIGDDTGKVMLSELAETIRRIAGKASQYDEQVRDGEVDNLRGELDKANLTIYSLKRDVRFMYATNQELAANRGKILEAEQARAKKMSLALDNLNADAMRLRSENTALKQLNKDMPGFGAVHEALKASQYIILAPRRKPQKVKSHDRAVSIAMSVARGIYRRAEVFALVPAGKAVRGAEWRA